MSAIPKMAKPPLMEQGDRMKADEFRRRYAAMPHVKKAELIDGEVFMPSPVSFDSHGGPHTDAGTWLGVYRAHTPGTDAGDNATVALDLDNEPQPDLLLVVRPECGGQVEIDADGYIVGAPELVFEVSASSRSIDLGRKMDMYRRHRVSEYIVWRTGDEALDWFVLRRGRFAPLAPDKADGLLKSHTFPGLWVDAAALVRRDLATVLAALTRGVQSPAHAKFVKALAKRRR
jgi:Uma2 family endonuclease